MATGAEEARVVRSRKLGSENGIVIRLPAERFTGAIAPHWDPPVDEQGRYLVMLLAQDCNRCSFGDDEVGAAHELHLWLQLGSASEAPPIAGANVSLPSQQWLALFVATDSPMVVGNLRSFGFAPARLTGVELRTGGGSITLEGGAHLEWLVAGEGRGPATVGIRHDLFMPGDRPDAVPHRVAALITDAVMGQPGELRVDGESLEPFLVSGERGRVLVHRMPALEADIVWRPRSEES